ncbi:MAG: DUF5681 domain-containing protein [Beijerinckiaceae bacterium]
MKPPKPAKNLPPSGAYKVGYGKPPKSGQFKPGQSGNPKGRPKKPPTTEELFLKEAARLVGVRVGDQITHMSRREALVRKVFQMALEGNLKAMTMLVPILFQGEVARAEREPGLETTPALDSVIAPDEQMLRRMFERFQYLSEPGEAQ